MQSLKLVSFTETATLPFFLNTRRAIISMIDQALPMGTRTLSIVHPTVYIYLTLVSKGLCLRKHSCASARSNKRLIFFMRRYKGD